LGGARRGGELDVLLSATDLALGVRAALIAMEGRGFQTLQPRRLRRDQPHGLETSRAQDVRHGFLLFHFPPTFPQTKSIEEYRHGVYSVADSASIPDAKSRYFRHAKSGRNALSDVTFIFCDMASQRPLRTNNPGQRPKRASKLPPSRTVQCGSQQSGSRPGGTRRGMAWTSVVPLENPAFTGRVLREIPAFVLVDLYALHAPPASPHSSCQR
jgi:hypothetical protein